MLFPCPSQQNVFPDRGTVYDFYFVKQASGSWNNWIERVDKTKNVIPKDAKVKCVIKHFQWALFKISRYN